MLEVAVLYYTIALVNAIIYLLGKKSNAVILLSWGFHILFVIGKRYDGSKIAWDLGNYEYSYGNWADSQTAEIGYKFLNIFANSVHIDFYTFYMLLATTYLMISYRFVKKIGGNMHLVIFAAMFYFVLIQCDQLRNQSAFSLLLLFVFPLTQNLKLREKTIAIVGLLIACTFHISFVLYFIPLILCFRCSTNKAWLFLSIILFLSLLIKATSSLGFMDSIIQNLIASNEYTTDRYTKYTLSNAKLSFLAPMAIYFVCLFLLLYWNKNVIKKHKRFLNGVDFDIFVKFFIFSSFFILMSVVNSVMYRFTRDISLMAIMYLGICSTSLSSNFKNRLVVFSGTTAICAGWFIFDIFLNGYWIDYLTNFFNNEFVKL